MTKELESLPQFWRSDEKKDSRVGIIMGSTSDLSTMIHASNTLSSFNVSHEVGIVSAHRTPELMAAYANVAGERGLQLIIAGAGGSAHLPGMVASETTLPVLGVAIESSPDSTNSAIGSMIRMPEGVPLATMGKNKAAAVNAALMSIRILALNDPELAELYKNFVKKQESRIAQDNESLAQAGPADLVRRIRQSEYNVAEGVRRGLETTYSSEA
ncbi:5-(carboxyamino)imidazole ribonucleotide mutase [Candidatus Saccharibacteria bacterium]|nr:5-(carboxyamino)imidazole ribonucleotide mutase [Candidatus Saccharibacteria bacterium]